jgi:hypothetical protein
MLGGIFWGGASMSKQGVKSHRYANRTPWEEATREVPSAWLEDEARKSSSSYSLLASWKGPRGGVPPHVMITLLRRRLRESYPELKKTTFPPASLQRAQDTLKQIWARVGKTGERHSSWRLVEGLLRLISKSLGGARVEPAQRAQLRRDQRR